MGGLNSLSGLNNVNVDFRPTIELNAPKTGDANQPLPGADAVPVAAPQPGKAEAKSVVRQLDVLLLGAAGKSVAADAATNVNTVGNKLVDIGVLTKQEVDKLESLARDATEKLKALDLAKAKSPEVKMALIQALGMQSTALPEEIDKDFYDKLMEMDANPDKKKEFLESLKPRISAAALKATENRLNEAIEYAKNLSLDGKVYDEALWKDRGILGMMPDIDQQVTITKSDGKKVKAKHNDNAYVRDFLVRECPSLYKRDFLHLMFAKPQSA